MTDTSRKEELCNELENSIPVDDLELIVCPAKSCEDFPSALPVAVRRQTHYCRFPSIIKILQLEQVRYIDGNQVTSTVWSEVMARSEIPLEPPDTITD
jgi:hypothetical protein